jgi:hypothetical protein
MDIPEEALPSQPTQDGHHELKKTEKKSQPESLSSRHLFEADSNCNGKSVHGQGKSNAKDKKKVHINIYLSIFFLKDSIFFLKYVKFAMIYLRLRLGAEKTV